MFEKIWNSHLVYEESENSIVYIDRHLVHEVTSPQAFDGLRMSSRSVLHPELTYAVPDHNVPTKNQDKPIEDPISALQVETLRKNCRDFDITLFDLGDERSGIVHVMGPEQGLTLPGHGPSQSHTKCPTLLEYRPMLPSSSWWAGSHTKAVHTCPLSTFLNLESFK